MSYSPAEFIEDIRRTREFVEAVVPDQSLDLLRRFVEATRRTPCYPFCCCCNSGFPNRHGTNCLWFQAYSYLRDQGIEITLLEETNP